MALLYATVGHVGTSNYLMVMSLLNFAPEEIRPNALVMNMFASLMAFLSFRTAVKFPVKLFIPIILFSVPAAYLGGSILVDTVIYKRILDILLFFPILKFVNVFPVSENIKVEKHWWLAAALGLLIGFFLGLIGIGGGIILSLIILMLGWASMKETVAVSALFIFLNSVAGFIGAGGFQLAITQQLWIVMPLTIAGGFLGAYLGAFKFDPKAIKIMLTIILFVAAVKLIWTG